MRSPAAEEGWSSDEQNEATDIEESEDQQQQRPESYMSPSTSTSQMRVSLTATTLASSHFGVSDRATAAIATSVLQDMGLVSEEDKSLAIDDSKI